MRTLLVAALVTLAGCAGETPAPPPADPPREELPPDPTPPPGARIVSAPVWEPGDWWNHTRHFPSTNRLGFRNTTVVAIEEVNGEPAYRLEVVTDESDPRNPPQVQHVSVATLAHVNDCSRAQFECQDRVPFLLFPLWEGKTWSYVCCGDVVFTLSGTAERVASSDRPYWRAEGEEIWRVETSREPPAGDRGHAEGYNPALGVVVYRESYGEKGSVEERWELAAYSLAHAEEPREAARPGLHERPCGLVTTQTSRERIEPGEDVTFTVTLRNCGHTPLRLDEDSCSDAAGFRLRLVPADRGGDSPGFEPTFDLAPGETPSAAVYQPRCPGLGRANQTLAPGESHVATYEWNGTLATDLCPRFLERGCLQYAPSPLRAYRVEAVARAGGLDWDTYRPAIQQVGAGPYDPPATCGRLALDADGPEDVTLRFENCGRTEISIGPGSLCPPGQGFDVYVEVDGRAYRLQDEGAAVEGPPGCLHVAMDPRVFLPGTGLTVPYSWNGTLLRDGRYETAPAGTYVLASEVGARGGQEWRAEGAVEVE